MRKPDKSTIGGRGSPIDGMICDGRLSLEVIKSLLFQFFQFVSDFE